VRWGAYDWLVVRIWGVWENSLVLWFSHDKGDRKKQENRLEEKPGGRRDEKEKRIGLKRKEKEKKEREQNMGQGKRLVMVVKGGIKEKGRRRETRLEEKRGEIGYNIRTRIKEG
jgi:hypothetical protein